MPEFIHCTLVPNGIASIENELKERREWLRFSMFLTPVVSETKLEAFQNWPGTAGLPGLESLKDRTWSEVVGGKVDLAVTLRSAGYQKTIGPNEIRVDFTWWRSHRKYMDSRRCQELWALLLGETQVLPAGDPAAGASNPIKVEVSGGGAQASSGANGEEHKVRAVIDGRLDDDRQAITGLSAGAATAEGLSSDSLNQMIVGPLLKSHALGQPLSLIDNEEKDLEKAEYVRTVREALSRLDRSGTAGPSSTAEWEAAKRKEAGEKCEFHETLSAMADHPALLRALGLLVDLLIPAESVKGLEKFTASASIRLKREERYLLGQQTPIATECWLRGPVEARLFTPKPKEAGELVEGLFLKAEGLGSIEPDLIAGLRTALREVDGQPNERRAVSLLTHGISVYRRHAMKFASEVATVLANQGRGFAKDHTWSAEDLIKGFVVEARSKTEDSSEWSDWFSLNWREAEYRGRSFIGRVKAVGADSIELEQEELATKSLVKAGDLLVFDRNQGGDPAARVRMTLDGFILFEGGADGLKVNKGDRVWKLWDAWTPGCDEGPVSFATTESRQPLSGWLLGKLTRPAGNKARESWRIRLEEPELPERWLEILKGLDPEIKEAAKSTPLYLLATRHGIVVVADGLEQEPAKQDQYVSQLSEWNKGTRNAPQPRIPRPIESFIRAHLLRQSHFRFGEWVDLSGRPSQSDSVRHQFFVAASAASGTTDRAVAVAGSVISGSVKKNHEVVSFSLRRSQLEDLDSEALVRAPDGRVYIEADGEKTSTDALSERIESWTRKDSDQFTPAPLLMARGVPVLIPESTGAAKKMALIDGGQPRLSFVRQEGNTGIFKVPDLAPGAEVAANEVRIYIDPSNAKLLDLISGTALIQNGIYTIELEALGNEPLRAKRIREETRLQSVKIQSLRRGSQPNSVILEGEGLKLLIDEETIVAIEEPLYGAPNQASSGADAGTADGFSGGEILGGSGGSSQPSGERLLGRWAEQGLRVNPGDSCRLTVSPCEEKSGVRFRVSKLTVVAHDPGTTSLGIFKAAALASNESQYLFKAIGADQDEVVTVDDGTTIIAPPAWPNARWRELNAPPMGELVKLFRRSNGETAAANNAADRVEVLSALSGIVTKAIPGEGAPSKLDLAVAGFRESLSLEIPTETIRPERLALLAAGKVDVRLGGAANSSVVQISLHTEGFRHTEAKGSWVQILEQAPFEARGEAGDGRLHQITVTWRLGDELPEVKLERDPKLLVTGQVARIFEEQRRIDLLVLQAPAHAQGLTIGGTSLVFLEDVWSEWKDHLLLIQKAGMPIEFEADLGVYVPSKANRTVLQPADWLFVRWPKAMELNWQISSTLPLRGGIVLARRLMPRRLTRKAESSGTDSQDAGVEESSAVMRLVAIRNGADFKLPELLTITPADVKITSNKKLDEAPALLADQFILEDSIFHWFGQSLVVSPAGNAAVPASAKTSESMSRTLKGLHIVQRVPEGTMLPLRVGHSYEFALRAVYITGPASHGGMLPPMDARIRFSAFGEFCPLNRFLRFDSIGAPRVGWPLNPKGLDLIGPRSRGTAPIVNGPELIETKEWWGSTTDLLVYSDTRLKLPQNGRVAVTNADKQANEIEETFTQRCNVHPEMLIRPPEISVHQAEILGMFEQWSEEGDSLRNSEAIYHQVIVPHDRVEYGLAFSGHDFHDYIDPADKKLRRLPEDILQADNAYCAFLRSQFSWTATQLFREREPENSASRAAELRDRKLAVLADELNQIVEGAPIFRPERFPNERLSVETRKLLQFEATDSRLVNKRIIEDVLREFIFPARYVATPGLLLPRLPDPDALGLVVALNGTPLGECAAIWNGSRGWPGWKDTILVVRPPSLLEGTDNLKLLSFGNQRLELLLPMNTDATLELRAKPTERALKNHAMYQLLTAKKFTNAEGNQRAQALRRMGQGLHPSVSSAINIRLRHCTPRPATAPRNLSMTLKPRLPKSTFVQMVGTFEADIPSTSTLRIQAATKSDWLDDPKEPLPSLPQKAMQLLVYRDKPQQAEKQPATQEQIFQALHQAMAQLDQPQVPERVPQRYWGVASDTSEIIDPAEVIITEHSPNSSIPFDPTTPAEDVRVEWRQELGDGKHHVVFYRALAVSRFVELFPPGICQTAPLPGPFTKEEIEFIRQKDPAVSSRESQAKEVELFGWHRVEMPATVRPAPPLVREATTVYHWDPTWSEEQGWSGGKGSWSFDRTRTPGCRLWLERPWFSSGENEKLAVLCCMRTRVAKQDADRYLNTVSRWAKDPIHEMSIGEPMGLLTRADVLSAEPNSIGNVPTLDRRRAGESEVLMDDAELARELMVGIAPHTPIYHPKEQLWFCDLFFKLKQRRYTPFIWLSIARYQPHALYGLALSRPVRLENPVQIWPPRTLHIELTARGGTLIAQVELAGLASNAARHRVVCSVERRINNDDLESTGFEDDKLQGMATDSAPPPSIGVGEGMWESVIAFDGQEQRTYVTELKRDLVGQRWSGLVRIARDAKWSGRQVLRITVSESEVHYPAYSLDEGQRESLRPTYEESVVLPAAATAGLTATDRTKASEGLSGEAEEKAYQNTSNLASVSGGTSYCDLQSKKPLYGEGD